jgi:hypothetical protein
MPVVAIAGTFIIAIAAWGVVRLRRGRAAIQAAMELEGYEVLRMERRIMRQGPFWLTTTPSQIVFRVLVLEPNGRQRTVWARWGRRWLPEADTLELQGDQ